MITRDPTLDELTAFLMRSGLSIAPGVTAKAISSAERSLGISIPSPLSHLLQICGGTDADEVLNIGPSRHVRLWGVLELRVAGSKEVGSWAPALLFADYMLHS